MTNVFVYGTLRSTEANNAVLVKNEAKLIKKSHILHGFKKEQPKFLGFPYAVEDENSSIEGEVWDIELTRLIVLDVVEGVDQGLYRRKWIPEEKFFVYVAGPKLENFLERMKKEWPQTDTI